MSKIIILIITVLFILTGCTSTMPVNTAPRDVRILIDGGPYSYSTLFELMDEKVFEVASTSSHISWISINNVANEPGRRRSTINSISSSGIRERDKFELLEEYSNIIWGLIENVATNEADITFEWKPILGLADYIYVQAIIDGRMYWSVWHPDIDNAPDYWLDELHEYVNRDLLLLTYELIDLSPIQVLAELEPF